MRQEVRVLEFLQDNTKNKPNEDALFVSESKKVFIVADGVTRSIEEGNVYPDPSPASSASKLFCMRAPVIAETIGVDKPRSFHGEEDMIDAFREGNSIIVLQNERLGLTAKLDYFENDLAGCVAVIGALDMSFPDFPLLWYGYIGDCGLLVFDKDLNPVFLSSNNDLGPLELFREGMAFRDKREKMILWRKNLRNRPRERYLTYGVLTGEEDALAYVKTGHVLLESGDTAILFSDGILPLIFSQHFREAVRNSLYSGSESVELVRSVISTLTKELSAKHVANLDDDKAFIALQLA